MDSKTFEDKIEEMRPGLKRVARRYVSGSGEEEDIVQEAFLRAFRKLASLKNDECFEGWMRRTTVRIALDMLRDRRLSVTFLEEEINEETNQKVIKHNAQMPSLHKKLETAELLENAFARLPKEQREAVMLYDSEGLLQREVAEVTGVPVDTAKSRIYAGRERLRALIAPHFA